MSDNAKHDFAQEFYFAMRAAITGRVGRDARQRIEKAKNKSTKPPNMLSKDVSMRDKNHILCAI